LFIAHRFVEKPHLQIGNEQKSTILESGFKNRQKEFTPKQMKLICDRIGYPESE
jgi:hypothetical protein